jgi:hypothetical protein
MWASVISFSFLIQSCGARFCGKFSFVPIRVFVGMANPAAAAVGTSKHIHDEKYKRSLIGR